MGSGANSVGAIVSSMGDAMLDIVIPVYHEGKTVLQTVAVILEHVKTPFRARLVYDSPTDTTVEVMQRYLQDHPESPFELYQNAYGHGALNAIKTGLEAATHEYVLVTMADLSDDMRDVDTMVACMAAGADVVCGSRYMPGGNQLGGGIVKKSISRFASMSLRLITGIPTYDITNSFKLYRRSLLRELTIESIGGFEIGLEILVKSFLKGYRIEEVPTTWTDRVTGQSNFKLIRWLPHYLKWYLVAVFSVRRRSR